MGRRAYDMANGDFTSYEYQVPLFVITSRPPEQVARGQNANLKFVFVTDGFESAVAQASRAANEKNVMVVGGASTARQCLQAALADELHIDVRPVLLGDGSRFFAESAGRQANLEVAKVTELPTRTCIQYRIVKA